MRKLDILILLIIAVLGASCHMEGVSDKVSSEEMMRACCSVRLESESDRFVAVEKVLRDGFPVNNRIDDTGKTLLHRAIFARDEKLIEYLLDRGASIEIPDDWSLRPLDYALSETNLCKILTKKRPSADIIVDGLPVYILEKVFRPLQKNVRRTFLYVNGNPASSQLLEWLCTKDDSYSVSDYVESGKSEFMIEGPKLTSHEFNVCEVLYKKENDSKYIFEIRLRQSVEKKYADEVKNKYRLQIYNKIIFERKYGYWFCEGVDSIE